MGYRCWQIAEFIGLDVSTVAAMARKGIIPSSKKPRDRRWEFRKEDVATLIISDKKYFAHFRSYKPTIQLRDSYSILEEEISNHLGIYHDLQETAKIIGIEPHIVSRWIDDKILNAEKQDDSIRIYERDIAKFFRKYPGYFHRMEAIENNNKTKTR